MKKTKRKHDKNCYEKTKKRQNIDEKFKEILYNLIPIDQRELSY